MWPTRSRAESWRSPSPSRWTGYLSSRLILSSIPDSGGANCNTSSIGWATTSLKDLGNLPTTLPTPARLSQSFIFATLPVRIRHSPAGASVSARYDLVTCFIPRSPPAGRSVLLFFPLLHQPRAPRVLPAQPDVGTSHIEYLDIHFLFLCFVLHYPALP